MPQSSRYSKLPYDLDEDLKTVDLNNLAKTKIDHKSFVETNNKNLSTKGLTNLVMKTQSNSLGKQEKVHNSTEGAQRSLPEDGSQSKNQTVVGGPVEVIVNDTELFLTKLEHFREYSIMVCPNLC